MNATKMNESIPLFEPDEVDTAIRLHELCRRPGTTSPEGDVASHEGFLGDPNREVA